MIHLDQVLAIEERLSESLDQVPEHRRNAVAESRLSPALQLELKNTWEALFRIRRDRITHLPAIVFDDQAVWYGSDFWRAVTRYRNLKNAEVVHESSIRTRCNDAMVDGSPGSSRPARRSFTSADVVEATTAVAASTGRSADLPQAQCGFFGCRIRRSPGWSTGFRTWWSRLQRARGQSLDRGPRTLRRAALSGR